MLKEYLNYKYKNYTLHCSYQPYSGIYDEGCYPIKCVSKIKNKLKDSDMILLLGTEHMSSRLPYSIKSEYANGSITIKDLLNILSLFNDYTIINNVKCCSGIKIYDIVDIVVDDNSIVFVLKDD